MGSPEFGFAEAYQLVLVLMSDPTSWLHAAEAKWKHPVSREWMMLADVFDLQHAKASKRRPKPLPRPWPDRSVKIGGKKTVRRSAAEVLAILRPQK